MLMHRVVRVALFFALASCAPATGARPDWTAHEGALPALPTSGAVSVDLTWLSVTNVYLRVGPLGILTDGYVTRIPQSAFVGEYLQHSRAAYRPDSAAVARMQPYITKSLTPQQAVDRWGSPNGSSGAGVVVLIYNVDNGQKVSLGFPSLDGTIQFARVTSRTGVTTDLQILP